jgi:hypothetical protein
VSRLTADHAAAVLIDGDDPEWQFWAVTVKASPATRRIPVFVITEDTVRREQARSAGADAVLPPAMLGTELPVLICKLGRFQDDSDRAALIDQCAEPLPERAREAIRMFNAGEYYKQHDLFEAQWMEEERPIRDFYRAILQVGVAYYQITRGNKRGALKMLLRAFQWLNILPDRCQGVDIAGLRADAEAVRRALEGISDDADLLTEFDPSLLGEVSYAEDADS